MSRLACPHCSKPIAANPIGRWHVKFACPHCRGQLQFDRATNAIGVGGSLFFFMMTFAIVMGGTGYGLVGAVSFCRIKRVAPL